MASEKIGFTGVEKYKNHFDPNVYLNSYYNLDDTDWGWYTKFMIKNYFEVFSAGKIKGKTLVDIGSGPTIYQLLSSCEHFEEIIPSDYVDQNREIFLKWKNKEPGAFDWSPVIQYVCELEGDRNNWRKKEERLRSVIKTYLKCNILNENPVEPVVLPKVDCVSSCLCLEVACKDSNSYLDALKNMVSLIKPGGQLLLCGVLRSNKYPVGNATFYSIYLEEAFVRDSLSKVGCTIEKFEKLTAPKESVYDVDAYFISARKQM